MRNSSWTGRSARTMQAAFGWYTEDRLYLPTRSFSWKLHEFVQVYRQYRLSHPRVYALRLAYEIAFKGLPF